MGAGTGAKRALIFAGGTWHAAGPCAALLAGPWRWVVCADSGARHALALGFRPNLLVGDFDSIDPAHKERLAGVPTLRFPSDKDKTDTHLAVEWALEQGAEEVTIAAGLGGRLDHSLANVQLLTLIHGVVGGHRRGRAAKGVVTDGRQAAYLLVDRLELRAPAGTVLSLLPLTKRLVGLSERGVRWELTDADVELGETLTVSNEFTGEPAFLTLRRGMALVIVGSAD